MTPWVTLAATLAEHGLPALAERLRKRPGTVVRDVADALGTPRQPSAIEAALASDPAAPPPGEGGPSESQEWRCGIANPRHLGWLNPPSGRGRLFRAPEPGASPPRLRR